MTFDETIGHALRAIDDATVELRDNSVWLSNASTPWRELPQCSEAEAERRSSLGRDVVVANRRARRQRAAARTTPDPARGAL